LNFSGKAILNAEGVNFDSGISYKIRMSEFELFEELGRGQYGVVKKVYHKPTKVTMGNHFVQDLSKRFNSVPLKQ
jgi:mitogen-activated protein kinase kinase